MVLRDNNLENAGKRVNRRMKKNILPGKVKIILSRGEAIIIFKCICQRMKDF
jgi:hypothetical protein